MKINTYCKQLVRSMEMGHSLSFNTKNVSCQGVMKDTSQGEPLMHHDAACNNTITQAHTDKGLCLLVV